MDFLTIRNIVIYGIYGVDNVYTTVILSAGKEKPFTMIQLAANKHLCHCEGLFHIKEEYENLFEVVEAQ